MASLELQTERPSPEPAAAWRGSAFGLTLESAEPFPGLPPVEGAASGRVTAWREERASAVDKAWRPAVGEVLLDLRHSDGRQFLRIDAHEPIGFRIWAPYYGRHLVSTDGSEIASALPRVEPARWQRLFFAQVLPLAAVVAAHRHCAGDANRGQLADHVPQAHPFRAHQVVVAARPRGAESNLDTGGQRGGANACP